MWLFLEFCFALTQSNFEAPPGLRVIANSCGVLFVNPTMGLRHELAGCGVVREFDRSGGSVQG